MNTVTLEEIRKLLDKLQQNAVPIQEFCVLFEQSWNFCFDKSGISTELYRHLDFLFDEVVLFSPFPRAQWEYPMYRDEGEIRHAVTQALISIANEARGQIPS